MVGANGGPRPARLQVPLLGAGGCAGSGGPQEQTDREGEGRRDEHCEAEVEGPVIRGVVGVVGRTARVRCGVAVMSRPVVAGGGRPASVPVVK
ncbi:hypothetical protein GS425_07430 [Rhodococcus hoagii]|nr:hypothetical protein [Prescottella equi]